MTHTSNKPLPNDLDKRLYAATKKMLYETETPVSAQTILAHCLVVRKQASPTEARYHKGEYLRLFKKMIRQLDDGCWDYARPIMIMTDWFFSKRERDNAPYKKELKGLVNLVERKHFPIPEKKLEQWKGQLPVQKRCDIKPILQPVEVYSLSRSPRKVKRVSRDDF